MKGCDRLELLGVEDPRLDGLGRAAKQAAMTRASGSRQLSDDAGQGMGVVSLAVARRDRRDQLEPFGSDAGGSGDALLVGGHIPPQTAASSTCTAPSHRWRRPLVAGEGVMELLVRDAVGDRSDGVEVRLLVDAGE